MTVSPAAALPLQPEPGGRGGPGDGVAPAPAPHERAPHVADGVPAAHGADHAGRPGRAGRELGARLRVAVARQHAPPVAAHPALSARHAASAQSQ